ncbi:RDD family protein [Chitinophaga varians]|uniref:RDD family protein n=1 Tax=Chitinophaga varians TaxID=2202339 RepID=A0A847RXN6_9BACT|nr:RDD family protein [Chitinophaga varians]NLR65835.1 RDD family protein [Chitinophaga varians]
MDSFNQTKNTDLLSDLQEQASFEHASKGQRFANLLIDGIIVGVAQNIIAAVLGIGIYESILLSLVINLAYYTGMEGFAGGRTVGKMVTGTHVVSTNGQPLTTGRIMLRTVCRWVPFEPFSMLFGDAPWHDTWTDTAVVKGK